MDTQNTQQNMNEETSASDYSEFMSRFAQTQSKSLDQTRTRHLRVVFGVFALFISLFLFTTQNAEAAVSHSAASESHTGTTGSTNAASFSWSHGDTGTSEGVLVFVTTYADADYITSVTYGGVTMTQVAEAADTLGELARMTAFFLGENIPTGDQTIVVNRTNNATVMYASAVTVDADNGTRVAGTVLLQESGTYAEQSVDDGSNGIDSLRYAAAFSGEAAASSVGANSTALNSIVVSSAWSSNLVRETTAGQGSRLVGFTDATSDDRAAVHIAIQEQAPGVSLSVASESHTGVPTNYSTSEASFSWAHAEAGTPEGVLVFVGTGDNVDYISSVTYGGQSMTQVAEAVDVVGEAGRMTVFFKGSSLPSGSQTIVVNRSNNATAMYAIAVTVNASNDTLVAGEVLLQEDGTLSEQSVNDGSPGTNSLRLAGAYSGYSGNLPNGANSTDVHVTDFLNRVVEVVRETTTGQGARSVGFSLGSSDDRAVVHLAIREETQQVYHLANSESHTTTGASSTNQASFSWDHGSGGDAPEGVVVFVTTLADADYITSVTYDGALMHRVGQANDTTDEPGRLTAFFLGSNVPTGIGTIVVNRTNNATPMYATAASMEYLLGDGLALVPSGITTQTDNGTLTEQNIDDGSLTGVPSLRYAGLYSGLGTPPPSGANSTVLQENDFGVQTASMVVENFAGTGSRPVGWSDTTDDRAAVYMAVSPQLPSVTHSDSSESSVSASEASFSWSHGDTGTSEGVLVFVTTLANADYISSVTYGGVQMSQIGEAIDSSGEPVRMTAFFLGAGVPSGSQTIQVNRTNNSTNMKAYAVSVDTPSGEDTEVVNVTLLQGDGTVLGQNIDDGLTEGVQSLRYAALHSGLETVPTAHSDSYELENHDYGLEVSSLVAEIFPGFGSRPVGWSNATSDDRAAVLVAVRATTTTSYSSAGSYTYTVPEAVYSISIKAWGAGGGGGGGGTISAGGAGGGGGFASGTIAVTPGQQIGIMVGAGGGAGDWSGATNLSGEGGGGGGYSIATSSSGTLIIAAGGGGGGGGDNGTGAAAGGAGGAGGGTTGVTGGASDNALGGGGGTSSSGGSGGTGGIETGEAGGSLSGGDGAATTAVWGGGGIAGSPGGGAGGSVACAGCAGGGAGGSGYYGGGGGSAYVSGQDGGGGGGGGSSFATTSATGARLVSGSGINAANDGDPDYVGTYGDGGSAGATSGNGTSGNNGYVVITPFEGQPSITLSGILYSDEGSTPIVSTKTIKVAVGTSTPSVHSTTTNGSGVWTLDVADTNLFVSIPFLVWVDEDAVKASHFTKASSSVNNISGLDLYQNRVIISHEGTSGTSVNNNELGFYDGTDDTDIQYTVTGNNLSVRTGNELHIKTGKTYAPGGHVTVHGNAGSGVDGSFHLPASSVYTAGGHTTIAGNLSASSSATWTPGAYITTFNATTTGKTIDVASTDLGNVTFDGVGGGWTLSSNIETDDFIIENGSVTTPSASTSPTTVGNWDPNDINVMDDARFVAISGNYGYVAGSTSDNLAIVNISNPASPTTVGNWDPNDLNVMDGAQAVSISGNYAYIPGFTSDNLAIVDISNPASPTTVGNWDPNDVNVMDGAQAVTVSGNYAYVAGYTSDNLAIVDISNPASPTTVGNWDPNDVNVMDGARSVTVSGNYAYVVGRFSSNLAILDISNPASPTTVGNWDPNDLNVMDVAYSVFVSGNFAYVTGATSDNLVIVDISNPASPTTVGNWDPNDANVMNGAYAVVVSGNYAYVAGGFSNNLAIVDISNPASPTTVGNWDPNDLNIMSTAFGVTVLDNYAYITGSGSDNLAIVDLGFPSLTVSGDFENNGTFTNASATVHMTGNFLQEISGSLTGSNSLGDTALWGWGEKQFLNNASTSNLEITQNTVEGTPTTTGNWDPNDLNVMDTPRDVTVSGNYAYVAGDLSSNLVIVDISDPANPTTTGNWDPNDTNVMNRATSITVSGNYAYVAGFTSDNLAIVDISNPASPTTTANWDPNDLNVMDTPRYVTVSGNYAYVAGNVSDNLVIVDISSSTNPTTTGNWKPNDTNVMDGARSVTVSGNYAYITGQFSDNLAIVDISDPANPMTVSNWDPNDTNVMDFARYVTVSGNYAYVAGLNSDNLAIVDVSNPANPTTTGNWDPNDLNVMDAAQSVSVSGNYAYVVGETSDNLAIVDISDPANPTMVGNWDPNNTNVMDFGVSVTVSGNYAYVVGNSSDNLAIVDIRVAEGSGMTVASTSLTSGGNLRVRNNDTTYTAGTQTYIGGDLENLGTFNAGTGTTTLNGTGDQTLSGTLSATSSLYNLEVLNNTGTTTFSDPTTVEGHFKAIQPSTILVLPSNATTTMGTANIQGTAGNEVSIRSTTGGEQHTVYVISTTTSTFSYMDLKDSYMCPSGTTTAVSSIDSGNNNCWDILSIPGTLVSEAAHHFYVGQATTTWGTLTITDAETPTITTANDIRITIPTTTTNFRFDTGSSLSFGGSASAKVSATETYEDGNATMVIAVTENFASSDTLTISGIEVGNFSAVSTSAGNLKLYTDGNTVGTADATDTQGINITGSLTLANHADGQTSDKFSPQNKVDTELYAFRMTAGGEDATIGDLVISLTGIQDITGSNLTNLKLYIDQNSDGALDGGDTLIDGGGILTINGQNGAITFNTDWTATTSANTDYLVTGNTTSIPNGASTVFQLLTSGVTATGDTSAYAPYMLGEVTKKQHNRNNASGGGSNDRVGGDAPAGDGDQGGGGQSGGGELGETDGDNIADDPDFKKPSSTGASHNQWTNPTNAYNSDGSAATAGTNGFQQSYSGFGLSIPGSNTIQGISVKVDASGTGGAGTLDIALGWNCNTSCVWSTAKATPTLSGSDIVYSVGGSSDTWGKSGGWSPSDFSGTNFRIRITANTSSNTLNLDALQVRVYHQAGGGGSGGGGGI